MAKKCIKQFGQSGPKRHCKKIPSINLLESSMNKKFEKAQEENKSAIENLEGSEEADLESKLQMSCILQQSLTKSSDISKSLQDSSQHSLRCIKNCQATHICLKETCRQVNPTTCANQECDCQQTHDEQCDLQRLKIITKKMKEYDDQILETKEEIKRIFSSLIDQLKDKQAKALKDLDKKLIKQDAINQYNALKIMLSNETDGERFTSLRGPKMKELIKKKNCKIVMSQDYLEDLEKFQNSIHEILNHNFSATITSCFTQAREVKESLELNPQQENESKEAEKIEQKADKKEKPQQIENNPEQEQSQYSFFKVENEDQDQEETQILTNSQQETKKHEIAVQTQTLTSIPALNHQLNFSSTPSGINVVVQEKTTSGNLESDYEELKQRHTDLLDQLKNLKNQLYVSAESLNMYTDSKQYFHIDSRRLVISTYQKLKRLDLSIYE